jgi:hypothetical protein
MKPPFRPLFAKATDTPPGGSGKAKAATETETQPGDDGEGDEEEEEEEEDAPAGDPPADPENPGGGEPAEPAPAARLSPLQRGQLMLKSKGSLIDQIASMRAVNLQQAERIKQLEAASGDAEGLKAKNKELETQLAAYAKEKTNLSAEVRKELTALGVNPDNAPYQEKTDKTENHGLTGLARVSHAFKAAKN